jgi:hypothetical protein
MLVDEQKATSLPALRSINHYSTKNRHLEKAMADGIDWAFSPGADRYAFRG